MTAELVGVEIDGKIAVVPSGPELEIVDITNKASREIQAMLRTACKSCDLNGNPCKRAGGVNEEGTVFETYTQDTVTHKDCKIRGLILVAPNEGLTLRPYSSRYPNLA